MVQTPTAAAELGVTITLLVVLCCEIQSGNAAPLIAKVYVEVTGHVPEFKQHFLIGGVADFEASLTVQVIKETVVDTAGLSKAKVYVTLVGAAFQVRRAQLQVVAPTVMVIELKTDVAVKFVNFVFSL